MASKYNSQAVSGLDYNEQVNRPYQSGFGDIALAGARQNPASYMTDPSWYYAAQDQSTSGLNDAQAQQDKLAGNADAYDAAADSYDRWASGAGGAMEPGAAKQEGLVDRLQGGADKMQGQADWLWQNPGYTDKEKSDMMVAAQTPVAGSYTAAQGDLANQAARTGNSAAYGAGAADLARKKAQDLSMVGLNMQGQFANQRIAGQQFANQAQGAATGAQGSVGAAQGAANQNRQAMVGLNSNILNTGANIRQGGANIRTAAAGSNLQRSQTAQGAQGVQQNAGALSMAPYQLALGGYNTASGNLTAAGNQRVGLAGQNPSFGQQLGSTLAKLPGNASMSFTKAL